MQWRVRVVYCKRTVRFLHTRYDDTRVYASNNTIIIIIITHVGFVVVRR